MFRLTVSRGFRLLSFYYSAAWITVFLVANLAAASIGQETVITLAINVCILASAFAVSIWFGRVPEARKDLVDTHAALKRKCAELAGAGALWRVMDDSRNVAVHISRWRKLLVARKYQIAVGEPSRDWDYDPVSMRNVHFRVAHFYALSPGVADVRKFVEVASEDGEDSVTLMDAAEDRNAVREMFEIIRAPRDLNFATVDEMRELVMMLDKAEPWTGGTE